MIAAAIRLAEHQPHGLVGRGVRLALALFVPASLMMAALVLRYAVFEHFHGGEQALRSLWHVLGA
jgi:hypothetical protein